MESITKSFTDGDVIYREGEASRWAFEILEGRVDIIKDGPDGPTIFSRLKDGDLFGEMGLLEGIPRTATAMARGEVTVRAIPRAEFLRRVEQEPGNAFEVMSKLARKIRSTEPGLSKEQAMKAAMTSLPVPIGESHMAKPETLLDATVGRSLPKNLVGDRPPTMIEKMLNLMTSDGGTNVRPRAKKPVPQEFTVLVARFHDDYENAQHTAVLDALGDVPGINVQSVDLDLVRMIPGLNSGSLTPPTDSLRRAVRHGRRLLTDMNADLMLWGGLDETGRFIELRTIAVASSPGERPGRFTARDLFVLPVDFYEEWVPLIRALVLAALDPRSIAQGRILRSALPGVVRSSEAMGMDPSGGLGEREQAAILSCFGNICAINAAWENDESWYHTAADAYRKALDVVPEDDRDTLGSLQKHLGLVLQVIAEKSRDIDLLEEAAAAYRKALVVISRKRQPTDWGMIKYRLGGILYKIDMAVGDDDALRESIAALQSAQQVFDKYTHPIRWSEIANTLAQVLQVYGDNARSVPVIARAVKCCWSALAVRSPDTAPLQWASVQNTLGSALFLLAKHTDEPDYVSQAAEAFRTALVVYKEHGAGKLATVTERNLFRAERYLKEAQGREATEPLFDYGLGAAMEEGVDVDILSPDGTDWDAMLDTPQADVTRPNFATAV